MPTQGGGGRLSGQGTGFAHCMSVIFGEPQAGGFGGAEPTGHITCIENLPGSNLELLFSCSLWRRFQSAAQLFSESRAWWNPVLAHSH